MLSKAGAILLIVLFINIFLTFVWNLFTTSKDSYFSVSGILTYLVLAVLLALFDHRNDLKTK